MRVLITGGSGFIGSHLCQALRASGHEVRVLDLVYPVHPVPGVHYVKGDIRNISDIENIIGGVNLVYHLAAIVSVPYCQENPILSYQTNVTASAQILEVVRREMKRQKKPIRVVLTSTSAVYGNSHSDDLPIMENNLSVLRPISFYGVQKLAAEHAAQMFSKCFQIPTLILRLFNVYGPGQNPKSPYSGVIPIFADSLKEGQNLKLNGGGVQIRDFVSVHDVIHALLLASQIPLHKISPDPINIGSGSSISIKELAQVMISIFNSPVEMEITANRFGDILFSTADIQRAQNVLAWEPHISLRDGLLELLGIERNTFMFPINSFFEHAPSETIRATNFTQ